MEKIFQKWGTDTLLKGLDIMLTEVGKREDYKPNELKKAILRIKEICKCKKNTDKRDAKLYLKYLLLKAGGQSFFSKEKKADYNFIERSDVRRKVGVGIIPMYGYVTKKGRPSKGDSMCQHMEGFPEYYMREYLLRRKKIIAAGFLTVDEIKDLEKEVKNSYPQLKPLVNSLPKEEGGVIKKAESKVRETPTCSDCRKGISEKDFKVYEGKCSDCFP